jgi:hypothetical protein
MALKIDMLGYQYDDAVPSFVAFIQGNPLSEDGQKMFVYHRPTKRILSQEALTKRAEAEGYEFPEGEVGEDGEWLWNHAGIGAAPRPDQPSDNAAGGYPGGFNGNDPADMTEVEGITPNPPKAWTAGQYAVLGDGTEVYWDGEAWVEGRAVPVITSPSDGQTVYTGYYPIVGKGARPGAPVDLFSQTHPYANGDPQDTVKARPDGTFVFAGTEEAVDNETWTVVSAGQESAPVSVVTAEAQPVEFTVTSEDLVATVTITSQIIEPANVGFGDGTATVSVAADTPTDHTYEVAETYTVTVTPTGQGWTEATQDVTVTAPVEEPEPEPEPEPETPAEGEDTVGGAQ